ncbi:hypothetical protein [Salipiger sp.]|uniref:hypothetical protein n=1 Tax=Salipiger sp. TaxID=2078585 RepID=UPI003A9864E3
MTQMLTALTLTLALALPAASEAACFVEYKAKRDEPLKLQYGIAALPVAVCPSRDSAAAQLGPRLDRAGWTLLTVQSLSTAEPTAKMKANAGEFYLRF